MATEHIDLTWDTDSDNGRRKPNPANKPSKASKSFQGEEPARAAAADPSLAKKTSTSSTDRPQPTRQRSKYVVISDSDDDEPLLPPDRSKSVNEAPYSASDQTTADRRVTAPPVDRKLPTTSKDKDCSREPERLRNSGSPTRPGQSSNHDERTAPKIPSKQPTPSSSSTHAEAIPRDLNRPERNQNPGPELHSTREPSIQRSASNMSRTDAESAPTASGAVSEEPRVAPATQGGSHLTIADAEAMLEMYIQEMHEDHEYLVKRKFAANRRCHHRGEPDTEEWEKPENPASGPTKVNPRFVHSKNPFEGMESISKPNSSGEKSNKNTVQFTVDYYPDPRNSKVTRSIITVPQTPLKSDAVTLPPFKGYVSIRQNVLAENDRKLMYWPYFGDDEDNIDMREELETRFDALIDHLPRRVMQSQKSRKLGPYIISFLEAMGSSVEDVLRYLLDPHDPKISEQLLKSRRESCRYDFAPKKRKWRTLFQKLPALDEKSLHIAAIACHVFYHRCNLSIWFIVRDSKYAQTAIENIQKEERRSKQPKTFRELACRVCHLHNCVFHGEIRESDGGGGSSSDSGVEPGTRIKTAKIPKPHPSRQRATSNSSSSKSESSSDAVDTDDSDINFKKLVKAPARAHQTQAESGKHIKHNSQWWQNNSKTHLLHERHPFYPCSHEGTCEQAKCSCYQQSISCEKTCACAMSCSRRFRGCSCARVARGCFSDKRCECFTLNRECDPDLCGSCGAAEILDPVNRYNKDLVGCGNCGCQRNVPKRTLLGHSEVQGFGLYMGEKVRAHEYLGEYKGEIISKGEADRRGTIYQHMANNYLFNLNASQEVDSTRMGNKFRFINNSSRESTINCYAKPMLANTVTRIGMYARRDIGVGEELFFNYGYPPEATIDFWEKGEKPAASSKPKLQHGKKPKTAGSKIPKAGATTTTVKPKGKRGRPSNAQREKDRQAAAAAAAAAAATSTSSTTDTAPLPQQPTPLAGPSRSTNLTSRPRQLTPQQSTKVDEETLSARKRPERQAAKARSKQEQPSLEDFLTSEDHARHLRVFPEDDEEADAVFEPDEESEDDDYEEEEAPHTPRRGRKRKRSF